jgi:hypothetical protein
MPTFTDDVVVNDANNGTQVVANGTAPGNGGGVRVQKAGTDVGVAAVSGAIKGSSEAHLMVQATSGRKLLLAANGSATEQVTVDTGGSVGIGTSTPAQKLDVAGNVALSNNSAYYSRNTAGTLVPVPFVDGTNEMFVGSDNALGVNSLTIGSGQPMKFRVNSSERLRIDTSGKVGIGTTTPKDTLDVFGSVVVRGLEPWIDVRAHGALGNGISDDTAAIQAAINAVPAAGGTVFFPAGFTFACYSSLNLDGRENIRLYGGRAGEDTSYGPGANGPTLLYNGGGTKFISLRSAHGITFHGLSMRYAYGGFTGDFIHCDHMGPNTSDSMFLRFEHCSFSGFSNDARWARSLIRLNRAIITTISNCWFGLAYVGILGVDPQPLTDPDPGKSNYSNVVEIDNCTFNYQNTSAIKNAGEAWLIQNCTFEPLFYVDQLPKLGCAYLQDPGMLPRGFSFIGNWFGDATDGGTWISAQSEGMHVAGNFIAVGTSGTHLRLTDASGVHISGNTFWSGTAIALAGTSINGIAIMGNKFLGVSTTVSGTGIITPNTGAAYGNGGMTNQTW